MEAYLYHGTMTDADAINLYQSIVSNANNKLYLNRLYDLYVKKGLSHPFTSYGFGIAFMLLDDHDKAINEYIVCLEYGIKAHNSYYNSLFSQPIGSAFTNVLLNYETPGMFQMNIMGLAYAFLSNNIKKNKGCCWDAHYDRGRLFARRISDANSLIENYTGAIGAIPIPNIIADYYDAGSTAPNNIYKSQIDVAQRLHKSLEDITIGGRDADTYSLIEMVQLGRERHNKLFDSVNENYLNHTLTLSDDVLSMIKEMNT